MALACLPPEKRAGTIVFESACVGGDLTHVYGDVVANLTRKQMESALRSIPAWSTADMGLLTRYAEDQCPVLGDVCKQLRCLVCPYLKDVVVHTACVKQVRKLITGSGVGWQLETEGGTYTAQKVLLCTGANPVMMDLPKPSIPLPTALSELTLRRCVEPTHRIVVFGTSHSGTLVLRNLHTIGCTSVTAIYKGVTPFRWARDGDTEGLKQDSAVIADAIVGGTWGPATPTLISADDMGAVLRAMLLVDHVIYAVGFKTRAPTVLDSDGKPVPLKHDPKNAQIAEGLWGFGIGFPSRYTTPKGAEAPDVGFAAFSAHVQACLPAILA